MAAAKESTVKNAGLDPLEGLGYAIKHGPDITVGEPSAERSDPNYRDVLLEGRLRLTVVHLDIAPPSKEGAAP